MKMRIIFSIVALTIGSVCFGSTSFRWSSVAGGAKDQDGINLQTNMTVLAFVSGDSTISFDSGVKLQSLYGSGVGQDTFIGSSSSGTLAGRYFTSYFAEPTDIYLSKFAYLVLVDAVYVPGVKPQDIASGVYYGYSSMANGPLPNSASPGSPITYSNAGAIQTTFMNVPEPSSFALLGIGLGLIGLRRFRRK